MRGASCGADPNQSPVLEGRRGTGQEQVIRNGEKTDVGKKKIRDKGGERETKTYRYSKEEGDPEMETG